MACRNEDRERPVTVGFRVSAKTAADIDRMVALSGMKKQDYIVSNAASLLWIAEAVGIDELTVKIAYEAAVGAGDYRRACGAIRKIITWDMVYACV